MSYNGIEVICEECGQVIRLVGREPRYIETTICDRCYANVNDDGDDKVSYMRERIFGDYEADGGI